MSLWPCAVCYVEVGFRSSTRFRLHLFPGYQVLIFRLPARSLNSKCNRNLGSRVSFSKSLEVVDVVSGEFLVTIMG